MDRLRGRWSRHPPTPFLRVSYDTPRLVVLITAGRAGRDNVWPIDWHVPLSLEPEVYGIVLKRGGYGEELVREHGEFMVNFVPRSWEERIVRCGQLSGRDLDKFKATGLERSLAKIIAAPRVAGAAGWFECRVIDQVDVGSHRLFAGEVVHAERPGEYVGLAHRSGV